jgi:hypothetical protein
MGLEDCWFGLLDDDECDGWEVESECLMVGIDGNWRV